MRIGVVGCGRWGRNLVRVFRELAALAAICDSDDERLKPYWDVFPDVILYDSYSDLLTNVGLDAVAIATPAETHYELAKVALMRGKDVFVEKPMCLDLAEADELVQIAEDRKRILMVGHLLRYHPAFEVLHQLVYEGKLGRVNYVYSTRLNLGRVRTIENALWSFAPHDVSAILALTGQMPSKVTAMGGNYLNPNRADVTVSLLEFPSGTKAHIFVSWLHPYKEQKLVVVGDKQMAVFDDLAPAGRKLVLYPHQVEWHGPVPDLTQASGRAVEFIDSDAEPLRNECIAFIYAIESRIPPLTDGAEGRRVLQVLTQCQEAIDGPRGAAWTPLGSPPAGKSGEIFVHPTAIVDEGAEIGAGTKIWHFCHVIGGAKIGVNCMLGQNVFVADGAVIGDGVRIQNNVSVFGGVTLEEDVFVGPSAVFTNDKRPRSFVSHRGEWVPTVVRKGATIGANATIVCGVEIGRYAMVGAGSVVTKDVGKHEIVVGVPAAVVGWVCECGERLVKPEWGHWLECRRCREKYWGLDGVVVTGYHEEAE